MARALWQHLFQSVLQKKRLNRDQQHLSTSSFSQQQSDMVPPLTTTPTSVTATTSTTSTPTKVQNNLWDSFFATTHVQTNFGPCFGTYGTGNGELIHPDSLAIGPQGNIFVTDSYNCR